MTRRVLVAACALAATFLALAEPRVHAQPVPAQTRTRIDHGFTLAIDGEALYPIGYDPGFGGLQVAPSFELDVRLGYRIEAGPLFVQPEIDIGLCQVAQTGLYRPFGEPSDVTDYAARIAVGARLGLRGLVEPQFYVHVGGTASGVDNGDLTHLSGFALDAGLAGDIHVGRVTLGPHVGFSMIVAKLLTYADTGDIQWVKWVDIGAHVGVVL